MKLLILILSIFCISLGNCYFFPICSTEDKSCYKYFRLPSFKIPSFMSFGDGEEDYTQELDYTNMESDSYFSQSYNGLYYLKLCYQKSIIPVLTFITKNLLYFIEENEHMTPLIKYIPFLKEEKAKADSRLYLLFIASTLGIYLVDTLCLFYYQVVLLLPAQIEGKLLEQCQENFQKTLNVWISVVIRLNNVLFKL